MLFVDVSKKLGEFKLDISLQIESRAVTVFFGPSGSGKSTLAKLIAGLCVPDSGRILFEAATFFDSEKRINLPPESRGVGFLFQEHRLFPHMNVYKNLSFGHAAGGRRACCGVMEISEIFGIAQLLERKPSSLSGGESQRVALARAILAAENFIIMDEPLSSLDEALKDELLGYIEKIPSQFGLPIIYITHSKYEALRLAEHVVIMKSGKVEKRGPVSEMLKNGAVSPLYI